MSHGRALASARVARAAAGHASCTCLVRTRNEERENEMKNNEQGGDASGSTLALRQGPHRLTSFVASGWVAMALAVALSATSASAQTAGASRGLPACISVTPYARYIPYGYNQFVILKSECAKAATCTVTTESS